MSHTVHQIRYRWSPSTLLSTRGMGPVESTLTTEGLAVWDQYLRDHVWAVGPEPGFTFFVHSDIGILVRKITTTADADGRSGSAAHVLLSRELTAQRALGLTSWDGWDNPSLGMLRWAKLESFVEGGLEDVRARAQALDPERLAGLFTQLLNAPGEGYTVIGETDPLAMACALGDLYGRTPTFATDEADDNGSHLPTAVFLRHASVSSTVATRRRLIPSADRAEPTVRSFAIAAVDAYTADGMAGIAHIQRDRPPADLAEVREWAAAAQFTPGVLATIARLPSLPHDRLAQLVRPDALERLKASVRAASSRELGDALDRELPFQVLAILVDEAVARTFSGATDHALLARLAAIRPLPPEWVAKRLPLDLDSVACAARELLAREDRRQLLARQAELIPYGELMRWIDERAEKDPESALIVYDTMCTRARKASPDDCRALAIRAALVDAVRAFSKSEQQASAQIVKHLRNLRGRAFTPYFIAGLVARGDPVLLHALDTVITRRAKRKVVHRHVRLAYYRAHGLGEPSTAAPKNGKRT